MNDTSARSTESDYRVADELLEYSAKSVSPAPSAESAESANRARLSGYMTKLLVLSDTTVQSFATRLLARTIREISKVVV